MALKTCIECGTGVSSDAVACPKCGANRKKKVSALRVIAGVLVILALLLWLLMAAAMDYRKRVLATGEKLDVPATATPERKPMWEYSSYVDEMTEDKWLIAELDANESLNFSRPYQGENRPSLRLSRDQKNVLSVMLSIEKGMFNCGYRDCYVDVRFDDQPAEKYKASRSSSSGEYKYLFFDNEGKFVKRLKTASRVRIQADFHQQINRIMNFNVAGLKWD